MSEPKDEGCEVAQATVEAALAISETAYGLAAVAKGDHAEAARCFTRAIAHAKRAESLGGGAAKDEGSEGP